MNLPERRPRRGHPLRHLLRKEPEAFHAREVAGERALRFLGTAGFVVEIPDRRVVLDPFLTRPGIVDTLFGRLVPDEALIAREIPYADDVLIGHAHHDHILDAPALCLQTGARLVGSRAAMMVGRAGGVPEAQLVEVEERPGGHAVRLGPVTATAYRSRHGRVYFGRVTLPGDILTPPAWPPRTTALRHGSVFTWHLDLGGTRLLHVDTADYLDEELVDCRADVLCLCAIGRKYRQDYTRRIVELVRPKVVVPCHWDDFTLPWDEAPKQLPGVDVEGFVDEIKAAGAEAVVLGLGQTWRW